MFIEDIKESLSPVYAEAGLRDVLQTNTDIKINGKWYSVYAMNIDGNVGHYIIHNYVLYAVKDCNIGTSLSILIAPFDSFALA